MYSEMKYILCIVILSGILIILLGNFLFLAKQNYELTSSPSYSITQNQFQYTYVPNNNSKTLIIGDLLGINPQGYKKVSKMQNNSSPNATILFPGFSSTSNKITQTNFLNKISNSNNVVIADNFCIKNWSEINEKDIYNQTILTPGKYCFSEKESLFIDSLIKKHSISDVTIYYSNDFYKKLIKTFLIYLNESHINYTLVQYKNE